MANEKRLVDEFKNELMSEFIRLCNGNDFSKLTLLKIGDVIDRLYEKYSTIPTVDAVEVVRCKDCMWARKKDHREPTETPRELICQCFKHHYIPAPWGARMAVSPDDFCSYGERRTHE